MAKYLKKKEKKKNKKLLIPVLLVLVIIVGAIVWLMWNADTPAPSKPSATAEQTSQTTAAEETTKEQVQEDMSPIELADGLQILHISDYTGMYMEDGTNEVVSGVMMIILENTSNRDLQLAQISMEYDDFTAEFEVTNLPAGEKLVALERNRHSAVTQEPKTVETKNVIFFDEPMDIRAETLEISGSDGLMTVKNISGEDITKNFYIYYKNSATDLLYGGITYRVLIEGGVAAGETAQVFTGHYAPESSRIMSVDFGA